jgi:predicted 3-demethylubiquinone-9 3-methyltransferase (glyoxalase superfamily)
MSKICPCLWFDGEAEEAAKFYVSLLPGSKIETVQKNTIDGPAGKAGSVLVVEFTLAGQRFMALNGGMRVEYTHAVSFKIDCADQAEVDRLWDALTANGGQPSRCGWLRDRYGVSWQIVPSALPKYLAGRIGRAQHARCRRCSEWSSSTSRACARLMRAREMPALSAASS